MNHPQVTLIAAVSEDGFISRGTGVPWDLPDDRQHFRRSTAGQWLLVGRRTYLEMGGWFRKDQHPLILSSDESFKPSEGLRVGSVKEALLAAATGGATDLVVIGGGPAFAAAMPFASRLNLTVVHDKLGNGVPFPAIQSEAWIQTRSAHHPKNQEHAWSFDFTLWERPSREGPAH